MKAINDNQCVNGLLKGTSADVVNVPNKWIKELGWKINQPVEIRISDCSNTESQEWQEITIMKQEDVDMVYGEEEWAVKHQNKKVTESKENV